MAIFIKPSFAARTAVMYVTVGALTGVWSGIWYAYLLHAPPQNETTWYWCYGFMLTGLALLIIGLGIGRIGQSAKPADLPSPQETATVVQGEQPAATIPAVSPAVPAGTRVVTNRTSPLPTAPTMNTTVRT